MIVAGISAAEAAREAEEAVARVTAIMMHVREDSTVVEQGAMFDVDAMEAGRRAQVAQELTAWWMGQAREEIEATVDKAVEYGQRSMVTLGHALMDLAGVDPDLRDEALAIEMAIAFYVQGKLARCFAAYARGQRAKGDNWDDIAVYSRMAQRVRQTGKWVD